MPEAAKALVAWTRVPRRFANGIAARLPRNARLDEVTTSLPLPASPEDVVRSIAFYEEVPGSPPLLLRLFLPCPIRSEGKKDAPGDVVRCVYEGGHLIKQITAADARGVEFEVVEQRLGIEGLASMGRGCYAVEPAGEGSSVVRLTTCYQGHLVPRWFWRPLERILAHSLHRHILHGMGRSLGRSA
jgi:hypothetical protein